MASLNQNYLIFFVQQVGRPAWDEKWGLRARERRAVFGRAPPADATLAPAAVIDALVDDATLHSNPRVRQAAANFEQGENLHRIGCVHPFLPLSLLLPLTLSMALAPALMMTLTITLS